MYFWPLCPPNTTFSTILRAQGEPTRVVLGPGKARPAQPHLDRTSVFPKENNGFGTRIVSFSKGKRMIP